MRQIVVECALRASLIAGGTALALSMLRVKSAAARHAAWFAVTMIMLALPLWTAWGPRASLRILPAAQAPETAGVMAAKALPAVFEQLPPAPAHMEWNWGSFAAAVYLLGLGILALRLATGAARAQILARRATECERHLMDSDCVAPVTVGWLRPSVILPATWREWPQAQLDAVLAHEREHARRRDPLVACLALLNRAVFWFHPLAWWLERRLSSLAEEACDAAVLAQGHDRYGYSECLLEMARSVANAGARVSVQGMAMPGSSLPRRLRLILEAHPAPGTTRLRTVCAAVACAIVFALFGACSLDRRQTKSVERPRSPSGEVSADLRAVIVKGNIVMAMRPAPQQKDHTLLAVYLDLNALPDRDQAEAAVKTFLAKRAAAEDRLGVLVARDGAVRVVQDFTADDNLAVRAIHQALTDAPSGNAAPSPDHQWAALRQAIDLLGSLDGKKSLIYLDGGQGLSTSNQKAEGQAALEAAQHANVRLYIVNAPRKQ